MQQVDPPLIHFLGNTSVAKNTLEKLSAQGINSPIDLLLHLPLRYQDKTFITPVNKLKYGIAAQIEVTVLGSRVEYGKKRSLAIELVDDFGSRIIMRLYYFGKAVQTDLIPTTRLRCYGEPSRGKTGLELYHPSYQILTLGKQHPLASRLESVYPKLDGIGPKRLSILIDTIIKAYSNNPPPDPLLRLGHETINIIDCFTFLHFPPPAVDYSMLAELQSPAHQRLVREELVAQQLFMAKTRALKQQMPAIAFPPLSKKQHTEVLDALPFVLTCGQQRAIADISSDLAETKPMQRLVQGDVGSGKTIVALIAALQVIRGGGQTALMVPTELLSEQHYNQAQKILAPLKIRCALLRGSETVSNRRMVLESLALGVIDLIVGTHALFQQGVEFNSLGLVIVDEQHRFGVHQRMALRDKGLNQGMQPHQLIMTATPIPRTLTMTIYADLSLSVIDEMPPGRKPTITKLISSNRRGQLLGRMAAYCDKGGQVYWVCRLVSESEQLDCESAEQSFTELQAALPNIRFGLIHGRFARNEKHQTMQSFRAGEIQVLVATTVIEVGVDVPNANLIVIENAEQLGLAQLHQLRGRVGRSNKPAWCILLHSENIGTNARSRLRIMRENNSGFVIAEKDLKIRGPGQLLGPRQSGAARLRITDLQVHLGQLDKARSIAPKITQAEDKEVLIERWFHGAEQYLTS